MNRGACETCGRGYRRHEFDIDRLGRAILSHVCDPADIARFEAQHIPYGSTAIAVDCIDCGKRFKGTASSQRCHECKHVIDDLRRYARRRCVDCQRFAAKGRKRCQKCAEQRRLLLRFRRNAA